MQVRISAIGNVHHTRFKTSDDRVNRNVIGNTNTTNRKSERISGLPAYPSACKTPCIATVKPINTNPRLAIRVALAQTSTKTAEAPPDKANRLESGLAMISNRTVIMSVVMSVSRIPYFTHSFALSLLFIP